MLQIAYENWHWPQITYLVLSTLTMLGVCAMHGQTPKPYNAAWGITNYTVAIFLLALGGFFS